MTGMGFITGIKSQVDVTVVEWPHPEFVPILAEQLGLEVDGQSINNSMYLSKKVSDFGKTQIKDELFEKMKRHVAKNIAKVRLCSNY